MSEKIAEIRTRHSKRSEIDPKSGCYRLDGFTYEKSLAQSQEDVATLLAEVERLRADNERLHNEDTKTRHALKGWVYVAPDGGDEPTHERVAAVVAEIERLRGENERLRENVDRLGKEVERADRLREEIARVKADNRSLVNRALEAKP